jgi:CRP-like cAMP-binding protein
MKFNNDTLTIIRRSTLFSALAPDQFNTLISSARLYDLAEGKILFQQGQAADEVFICLDGFIKLFRLTPNGGEKIVDIIPPGNSFAEAVMFIGGSGYPVHAMALKPAMVAGINSAQYRTMLLDSPELCFNMMALMSQRMHWLLNEVDRLTLHNATFRLVNWLLETQEAASAPDDRIVLGVPKHVVASRLSIKPETFSRILKRLSDQQLINVSDQYIDLLDRPLLEEMIRIEL